MKRGSAAISRFFEKSLSVRQTALELVMFCNRKAQIRPRQEQALSENRTHSTNLQISTTDRIQRGYWIEIQRVLFYEQSRDTFEQIYKISVIILNFIIYIFMTL